MENEGSCGTCGTHTVVYGTSHVVLQYVPNIKAMLVLRIVGCTIDPFIGSLLEYQIISRPNADMAIKF